MQMISEGSCDTEDWSKYAENSALKHFKIYSNSTNIIINDIAIIYNIFKL